LSNKILQGLLFKLQSSARLAVPSWRMVRITHVVDSSINCGQCHDVCTVELPLSRLTFLLNREFADIFKYEPGIYTGQMPPLRMVTEQEAIPSGVEIIL